MQLLLLVAFRSCFDIITITLLTFSREFCSLMVKREREKETAEDIKQAFRVFDKVGCHKKKQMLRSC